MHRGREARLGRVTARIEMADRAPVEHRWALRARAATGMAVRWSLVQFGIDPTLAVMLRAIDEAAAELAAIPDTDELRRADGQASRRRDDLLPNDDAWLDDATRRLVERYRSGVLREPDLVQASLAELFAWCIARHAGAGTTPGLNQ